jgi:hypothetical protein
VKKLFLLILAYAFSSMSANAAYVSGVDDTAGDRELKISAEVKTLLDASILTYYKEPNPKKIDALLDIMAETPLLDRKTSLPPLIGFFTIVFPNNKDRVMGWMSRNNYNTPGQHVIVNALLHANMKESALLFAKAHKWSDEEIYRLRETPSLINLKKMFVALPGHIDTLWGAFFASGDPIYVEQIIDAMLAESLPKHAYDAFSIPEGGDALAENKTLAATTLRDYAPDHAPVREALEKRLGAEPESSPKKELFKSILGK